MDIHDYIIDNIVPNKIYINNIETDILTEEIYTVYTIDNKPDKLNVNCMINYEENNITKNLHMTLEFNVMKIIFKYSKIYIFFQIILPIILIIITIFYTFKLCMGI